MAELNERWTVVDEVAGTLQGEILKGLLAAQGIDVILSEESAGSVFGLAATPLGNVQILVPESSSEEAKSILDRYYSGELEGTGSDQEGSSDEDNP